jgi:hypothetical protein
MALSYPNIIDATGYWGSGSGNIIILWNNSGGQGYVALSAGNYDTNIVHSISLSCPPANTGLYWKAIMPLSSAFNFGFAKGFRCNSDTEQNCSVSPPTCSNAVQTASVLDFGLYATDPSIPSAPSGLSVTPGNESLTFSWNSVSNIFSYYLKLVDSGGNVVIDGYKPLNSTIHVFNNLTNGVTYTLHLQSYSNSDKASSEVTKSGTPAAPCTIPGCGFVVA